MTKVSRSFTDEHYTVLHLLKESRYAEQIATELKISSPTIGRRIRDLKAWGLIADDVRSSSKAYTITPEGENKLLTHEVSQLSYPTTSKGVHDLYIKLPIIQRPNNPPSGLWVRVNDKLKNNTQSHAFFDAISASVRETSKHICIQLRPRALNNYSEIYGIVAAAIGYTVAELSPHGYVLDVMHPVIPNLHITYEDEKSHELIDKNLKVKVGLGRYRKKLFEGDPDQPAYVEVDKTPTKNWETNDHDHAVLRAIEPEMIAQIQKDLATLTNETANLARDLNVHVPALKGLTKVTHRLDKILSQHTLNDFKK